MESNVRGIQMKKEFVMRGQTASGETEVLNFSGYKPGYAYRMTEFDIYPSIGLGQTQVELCASITAAKTYESPDNPNFNNEGLIATSFITNGATPSYSSSGIISIVNDTFLITQNLILAVIDLQPGSPQPVNWQCRFVSEKMNGPEEAATNYKQFLISDE
jgi:hypothetical protein